MDLGRSPRTRLAILGSGPIGLEAALAALERGWDFTLYEAAPQVAGNVRAWGHVRLFTPWDFDVSPRLRRHLEAASVEAPAGGDCPTGDELVERVLEPAAALPGVAPRLRLGTRVRAIGRDGLLKNEAIGNGVRASRPFRLLLADRDGEERIERADLVLDCTGTYGNPNSLGDGGIPAPGERALEHRVERSLPDLGREAAPWAGRTVLLAGAGHSAQTAALDLAELARQAPATRVLWALRRAEPTLGAVADDPLPARARLTEAARDLLAGASPAVAAARGVVVEALRPAEDGRVAVVLRRDGGLEEAVVDRVLSLTGGVPDHRLYRQLQVHECYATCGPMKLSAALLGAGGGDCLQQSTHGVETLRNPEPGFFILGAKSYGRNNTFLMRVGWQQVDEVMGFLDGAS